MYVLTDGELHDMPECENALAGFRPHSIEVHVYGFGDEFNAVALKLLVSDQIGGTVKPIVNEEDITRTFAHVAAVNRRLVGTDASWRPPFQQKWHAVTPGYSSRTGDTWEQFGIAGSST